jgi:hypothetical protein
MIGKLVTLLTLLGIIVTAGVQIGALYERDRDQTEEIRLLREDFKAVTLMLRGLHE